MAAAVNSTVVDVAQIDPDRAMKNGAGKPAPFFIEVARAQQ
jgi:hypothetical protein